MNRLSLAVPMVVSFLKHTAGPSACIALVLGVVGLALPTVAAASDIIIKFNDARPVRREQLLNDYGLENPKQLWGSTKGLGRKNAQSVGVRRIYTVDVDASTDVDALLEELNADPRIEYAEPNAIISINSTPNDTSFGSLWGMNNTGQTGGTPDADIDAPEAWDITTTSTIRVGVIDTGIDYTHADLAANIWTNPGEIDGDGIDNDANGYIDDIRGWDFAYDDNDPMDGDGHGTHVAGTIGAVGNNGIGVAGVAWSVELVAIKFLDDRGDGTLEDAIAAIEYAVALGLPITNNSWGADVYFESLEDAVEAAGLAGQLVIAAAGNDSADNDASPFYPSSFIDPAVVSVASTTHTDALSSFSNYGLVSVDLGAPGSSIYSTYPGGYATFYGTSMATPHVSGAAAVLWSMAPQATAAGIKQLLMQEGDAIAALNGLTVSGRRLNVRNALDSIPMAALVTPVSGETDTAVTFNASGSTDDDGIVSYLWTFGDTTTATTTTATVEHTYTTPGTYVVTATVNDGALDSAAATGSAVIAQANRTPVAVLGGPYNAETNQSMTMDGSGSSDADGDALTYHWNFGDTTTADTTAATTTHTYTAAGSYTVQLTIDDGEDTSIAVTTTATITAPPAPAPTPTPAPSPTPAPAEEPAETVVTPNPTDGEEEEITAPKKEKKKSKKKSSKKKKRVVVRRASYNAATHELTVVVKVQKAKGKKVTVTSKRFGKFTFKKKRHIHVLRKTVTQKPKRLRLRSSNGLHKTVRFE